MGNKQQTKRQKDCPWEWEKRAVGGPATQAHLRSFRIGFYEQSLS